MSEKQMKSLAEEKMSKMHELKMKLEEDIAKKKDELKYQQGLK